MATKKKATSKKAEAPKGDAAHEDKAKEIKQDDGGKAEILSEEEAEPDEELVETAVTWIRQKVDQTVAQGAVEIGKYVLENFFGDDPERVRSKDPSKNASFRSLAARCEDELLLSKSWLHNAVGVAVMLKALPAGTASSFQRLSHSHQVALLPVHDPVRVEKLASQAVSKQLTVRRLRDLVGREVEKVPKERSDRGRKPKPVILKSLDRSLKLLSLQDGRRVITKTNVLRLSAGDKDGALETVTTLIQDLQKLKKLLKAHKPAE